ncbi:glycerate kinase, partial [Pseudoalteromonas sp. 0802]|nr:glycerate kinase [Pseudoalteromonas sp. 0802]
MTVSASAASASAGSPRLLIAPDSFKEALAASDAAEAMARGVRRVLPEAQIDL